MTFPPSPPLSAAGAAADADDDDGRGRGLLATLRALPGEYAAAYGRFVRHNAGAVAQLEAGLRSLSYVIPPASSFRHAELASEALHAALQLLALFHDSLLARAVARLPGMPAGGGGGGGGSLLARYTRHWAARDARYRRVALLLQGLRCAELLAEMAAKRRGDAVRWRVVVVLELLKALCRLLLLRLTGGRMAVPPLPERVAVPDSPPPPPSTTTTDDDDDDDADLDSADARAPSPPPPPPPPRDWAMPRTGLTLPPLPRPADVPAFLTQKVLTADDIRPPPRLLRAARGPAHAAELLHILRPVVYALAAAAAAASGRRGRPPSWFPWLLGLALDLAARRLRANDLRETALERDEWARRARALAWWALRGAFYAHVSKPLVVDRLLRARWMPGLVAGIVADYAFLWEEYHFATADM